MTLEDLLDLLDEWAKWMRHDDPGLGYPKKSIGISTGGASSNDSFENMLEQSDNQRIKALNAAIYSLDNEESSALYHRYLKTKKPFYYELKLQIALDKLLIIVERKIY